MKKPQWPATATFTHTNLFKIINALTQPSAANYQDLWSVLPCAVRELNNLQTRIPKEKGKHVKHQHHILKDVHWLITSFAFPYVHTSMTSSYFHQHQQDRSPAIWHSYGKWSIASSMICLPRGDVPSQPVRLPLCRVPKPFKLLFDGSLKES